MALRFFLLLFCAAISATAFGQRLELRLYDLNIAGGSIAASNPVTVDSVNVVLQHPSFHPTEPLLLYATHKNNRSSVTAFNYTSGQYQQVLESDKLVVSPQITPDKKFVSALVRNPDKKYSLCRFPLSGGEPLVTSAPYSVQSYLWLDDNNVFIVADGNPNTLELATLRPFKSTPISKNVGEVLQRSAKTFAFLHKISVDTWSVKQVDQKGSVRIIADVLPESDMFVLTPDGNVIVVNENKLFGHVPSGDWREAEQELLKEGIIRSIGINAAGNKLFVLVELPL